MSTVAISYTPEIHGENFDLGVSDQVRKNLRQCLKIYWHYHFPVSRPEDYVTEFYSLVHEWKRDTQFVYTLDELVMHPAYQRIIGMGEKAIPMLLRELDEHPDHWFWALEAITGAHPVFPSQQGKIDEMAKEWLHWAEENGYEW